MAPVEAMYQPACGIALFRAADVDRQVVMQTVLAASVDIEMPGSADLKLRVVGRRAMAIRMSNGPKQALLIADSRASATAAAAAASAGAGTGAGAGAGAGGADGVAAAGHSASAGAPPAAHWHATLLDLPETSYGQLALVSDGSSVGVLTQTAGGIAATVCPAVGGAEVPVWQAEPLPVPPFTAVGKLTVIKAWFGEADAAKRFTGRGTDVTAKLRAAISADRKQLHFNVKKAALPTALGVADPYPGYSKVLAIRFSYGAADAPVKEYVTAPANDGAPSVHITPESASEQRRAWYAPAQAAISAAALGTGSESVILLASSKMARNRASDEPRVLAAFPSAADTTSAASVAAGLSTIERSWGKITQLSAASETPSPFFDAAQAVTVLCEAARLDGKIAVLDGPAFSDPEQMRPINLIDKQWRVVDGDGGDYDSDDDAEYETCAGTAVDASCKPGSASATAVPSTAVGLVAPAKSTAAAAADAHADGDSDGDDDDDDDGDDGGHDSEEDDDDEEASDGDGASDDKASHSVEELTAIMGALPDGDGERERIKKLIARAEKRAKKAMAQSDGAGTPAATAASPAAGDPAARPARAPFEDVVKALEAAGLPTVLAPAACEEADSIEGAVAWALAVKDSRGPVAVSQAAVLPSAFALAGKCAGAASVDDSLRVFVQQDFTSIVLAVEEPFPLAGEVASTGLARGRYYLEYEVEDGDRTEQFGWASPAFLPNCADAKTAGSDDNSWAIEPGSGSSIIRNGDKPVAFPGEVNLASYTLCVAVDLDRRVMWAGADGVWNDKWAPPAARMDGAGPLRPVFGGCSMTVVVVRTGDAHHPFKYGAPPGFRAIVDALPAKLRSSSAACGGAGAAGADVVLRGLPFRPGQSASSTGVPTVPAMPPLQLPDVLRALGAAHAPSVLAPAAVASCRSIDEVAEWASDAMDMPLDTIPTAREKALSSVVSAIVQTAAVSENLVVTATSAFPTVVLNVEQPDEVASAGLQRGW